MSVSVVTPSLPERGVLLAQALDSVAAQTTPPAAHLIAIDHAGAGPVALRNDLANAATTEWVAFLDDDDLLYPRHLETLLTSSDGADVVYPWCDVEGRGGWTPNQGFDASALRSYNFIPVTTLVRRSAFLAVGGFPPHSHHEDWLLWLAMLDAGARFRCVPEVTWRYRFNVAAQRTPI